MNKARSDRGTKLQTKSSLAKTSDGREIEAAEKKAERAMQQQPRMICAVNWSVKHDKRFR